MLELNHRTATCTGGRRLDDATTERERRAGARSPVQ